MGLAAEDRSDPCQHHIGAKEPQESMLWDLFDVILQHTAPHYSTPVPSLHLPCVQYRFHKISTGMLYVREMCGTRFFSLVFLTHSYGAPSSTTTDQTKFPKAGLVPGRTLTRQSVSMGCCLAPNASCMGA